MTDTAKWEYLVETIGADLRSTKPADLQAGLNNLGELGWEVLEVHQVQGSRKWWIFAKRPLTEAVRKQRIRELRGW